MKKHLLFPLILLCWAHLLNAEPADIELARKWICVEEVTDASGNKTWKEIVYSTSNQLKHINGKNYFELFRDSIYWGAIRWSPEHDSLFYRSETGEYLLCAFFKQVGTICQLYANTSPYKADEEETIRKYGSLTPSWIVKSKSSIPVPNTDENRTSIVLEMIPTEDYPYSVQTTIIQAVGTQSAVFPISYHPTQNSSFYTLCAISMPDTMYESEFSFDLTGIGIVNDCPNWHLISDGTVSQSNQTFTPTKQIVNGRLFILRNGRLYDVLGR